MATLARGRRHRGRRRVPRRHASPVPEHRPNRRPAASSCAASTPATAPSTCSTASISPARRVRCTRCSARTARGSPPRSRSRAGRSARRPARCGSSGEHRQGRSTDALARAGLCLVPEGRGIFPNLTVTENLRMATYAGDVASSSVLERAFTRFPRLSERRKQLAGTLSGGEQQMLSMARALATDPKVLLLDELSMGLAPLIVEDALRRSCARIAAEGPVDPRRRAVRARGARRRRRRVDHAARTDPDDRHPGRRERRARDGVPRRIRRRVRRRPATDCRWSPRRTSAMRRRPSPP